ncbi:hypothetical protein HG535_0E05140 [Zygotorulaspora mrakii]|uniref:Asparagine-rich protein n=1 Tax=Zygotorulaspora mrakii TaxID=42260 RepID=A0A7H9B4A6_ZYGMR|nr:uncharacterized protein HG535_0E05140 [Zygotorulaspora mrakii]QLG73430.1 hypothetical protein HG535_0E05140 [Zygotorulaspora mrakii]
MHYVVLEVQTSHIVEKPKDQCRVRKLSYQIIDADSLKPSYDEESLPFVSLDAPDSITFEQAIENFDRDIQKAIGTESEFVFCSLNSTWDIRVTLPRQARDEGFMLPSYLQHPKVFDLWKEYERWCINHPEVISLKKNGNKKPKDISEIFKLLDIPDRASNEVVDVRKTVDILLQLHKKCTTPEDNSMVLTLPYDSYSDIRNFLQELSTVLYLNNLPPDTTQSELESWFTQFGARPIGFWTVKNIVEETSNVNNNWSMNNSPYVEEQDSISGFVVFQSHEEATAALTLNGRSILSNMANTKQPRVVEHIVEIQPSSTRVLERAQTILSPFPQSKNKPRPGDWNCPSCGFSNFQRRTSCFRCSFPSTSSQNNVNKLYMSVNSNNANVGNLGTNHDNNGNANGNPNLRSNQTQFVQNLHIQTQIPPHARVMTPTYGESTHMMNQTHRYNGNNNHNISSNYNNNNNNNNNSNGNTTRYNPQSHGTPGSGSNVPFRAGDWKCPTCAYHNFAKNVVCLRCGGPKMTISDLENKLMDNSNNSNSNNITNDQNYNNNLNAYTNKNANTQTNAHTNTNTITSTNTNTNVYNKSFMGGLMNTASMGSTASLNEYGSNRRSNGNFSNGDNSHGFSNSGLGVSLDVRSSSEPKW